MLIDMYAVCPPHWSNSCISGVLLSLVMSKLKLVAVLVPFNSNFWCRYAKPGEAAQRCYCAWATSYTEALEKNSYLGGRNIQVQTILCIPKTLHMRSSCLVFGFLCQIKRWLLSLHSYFINLICELNWAMFVSHPGLSVPGTVAALAVITMLPISWLDHRN